MKSLKKKWQWLKIARQGCETKIKMDVNLSPNQPHGPEKNIQIWGSTTPTKHSKRFKET